MQTYTIELWDGPVCDQKRNGRCWIYASLNPIRQKLCERYQLENFEFSTNYIFFYDQFRKSEDFLDRIIELREAPLDDPSLSELLRQPIASVGQWCYFGSLAKKHGLVPLEAMPDTDSTVDGSRLTALLSNRLRMGAKELRSCDIEEIEKLRDHILSDIQALLRCCLGTPPASFSWSGETLTPHAFMADNCAYSPDDYLMLIHHPSARWPCPALYHELANPAKQDPFLRLLSVDMETMKALALRQLFDGEQVVVGVDVRKQSSRSQGILDTKLTPLDTLDKADAIVYREINACHVMSLDGVQLSEAGVPLCWKVQDSHGMETGSDGHYRMTDAWFESYVLNATVKKCYLSPDLLALLDKPPVYMPKEERF